MKLVNTIEKYSPKVRKVLNKFLSKKIAMYPKRVYGINAEVMRFIKKYTLAEISQPRPALVLVGYHASGKKIDQEIVNASVFTTFITKYLAIHDDVFDLDTVKNGVSTVHVQCRKFNNNEKMGNDLAILAGDFLWSWAIEVIINSQYPLKNKIDAINIMAQTNHLNTVGQVMDLDFVMRAFNEVTYGEIWDMYTHKAAFYCYVMPLTVGAILGNLPTEVVKKFGDYGKLVGSASQLKDDIEGVFGNEGITRKSNIIDLRMGVKSLLIVKSFELGSRSQRDLLRKYVGNPGLTQKQADQVRKVIEESGARSYCEQMLHKKGVEALRILQSVKNEISFDSWEYLDDLVRFRLGLS